MRFCALLAPCVLSWAGCTTGAEEVVALVSEGAVHWVSLNGTVALVARSDRFSGLLAQRHAVSRDGVLLDLNSSPGTQGLQSARLCPGSTIADTDFSVRVDDRWRGLYPAGLSLSPDGSRLCVKLMDFDRSSPHFNEVRLVVIDMASGDIGELTHGLDARGHCPMQMRWSPDSKRVAFYCAPDSVAQDPAHMSYELHAVSLDGRCENLAGRCERPVHLGAVTGAGPLWSADSRSVFFVGNYGEDGAGLERGFPLTYVVSGEGEGGAPRVICSGSPSSLTPDGRYLFASVRAEASAHLRVDLQTGEKTELGEEWMHALVSWSGKYVACFPPGESLIVFSLNGEVVLRMDSSKLPAPPAMTRAYWIEVP